MNRIILEVILFIFPSGAILANGLKLRSIAIDVVNSNSFFLCPNSTLHEFNRWKIMVNDIIRMKMNANVESHKESANAKE